MQPAHQFDQKNCRKTQPPDCQDVGNSWALSSYSGHTGRIKTSYFQSTMETQMQRKLMPWQLVMVDVKARLAGSDSTVNFSWRWCIKEEKTMQPKSLKPPILKVRGCVWGSAGCQRCVLKAGRRHRHFQNEDRCSSGRTLRRKFYHQVIQRCWYAGQGVNGHAYSLSVSLPSPLSLSVFLSLPLCQSFINTYVWGQNEEIVLLKRQHNHNPTIASTKQCSEFKQSARVPYSGDVACEAKFNLTRKFEFRSLLLPMLMADFRCNAHTLASTHKHRHTHRHTHTESDRLVKLRTRQ